MKILGCAAVLLLAGLPFTAMAEPAATPVPAGPLTSSAQAEPISTIAPSPVPAEIAPSPIPSGAAAAAPAPASSSGAKPARQRDFSGGSPAPGFHRRREAASSPPPEEPWKWGQQGPEYRFSLGALKLANGQALSYMPLEVGWRFASGWRLRAGLELFYYTGLDQDKYTADNSLGPQQFYYQMQDVRLSALYEWPLRSRWRPLAGMTVDTVYGGRQFSYTYSGANPTPPNPAPPQEPAYSFEALGAEGGVEYRGGPHWSLSLEARYVLGLGYWANMAGMDFGWHYLF
ncbi:MAG TPA: hypothetical protein VK914_01265 [bacterium]|nr:hypothetical protein [bacterium]